MKFHELNAFLGFQRNGRHLFPFVHDLGNGMADCCPCLFDFFPCQANCDADLQCWKKGLFRLQVVMKGLHTGNKDTVR